MSLFEGGDLQIKIPFFYGETFSRRRELTTTEKAITFHNTLCWSLQIFISIVFSLFWGHFNSQRKLKTMLMQKFGETNKEYYVMVCFFFCGDQLQQVS